MAHHLAAAAGAAVQYRRAPSIAHRTQDDRASSQHTSSSSSRLDLTSSVESDLCCMEDGWDKESPAPAKPCTASRAVPVPEQARCGARLTPSERAQLRRSRPEACLGAAAAAAAIRQDSPREERLDSLLKMLSSQEKFRPAGAAGGGRARCHSVSPFVVERRRCFVTWKNKMATFLGYSRDTVAVALNYFDRYTCARHCSPTTAQAVAATALHLAAKFEETNPASLRHLIKYIAVFTPDQLLVMEMSMLKVLNWDLRPVTVYDFVRAFCDLLPSTAESWNGMPSTLLSKEDEAEEAERLRTGAEEIADLSSNEICFVDFLPSTVAISAILVSVSLGTSSSPPSSSSSSSTRSHSSADSDTDTEADGVAFSSSSSAASHEHVLETFCSVDDFADSAGKPAKAAAAKLLRSILDCVRLLERHLSDEYPTVAAAASHAADRVTRYAGITDEPRPRGGTTGNDVGVGGGGAAVNAAVASDGAGGAAAGLAGRKKPAVGSSKIAAAGQAKSRRCSTPTGVEGIVHIEMAAIRNSSVDNGGGGGAGGGARGSVGAVHEPAKLSSLDKSAAGVGVGGGEGKSTQKKHPRPAPCATRPCGGGSFPFSSEDVAFARAAKRKKLVGATAAAAAAAATTVVAAPTAAMPAAATSQPAVATTTTTKKTVVVQTASGLGLTLRGAAASSSSWQPFSSASLWRSGKKTGLGSSGGNGSVGAGGVGVGAVAGSSLLCSRKRAAEALGHCENGSGFGAPAPRVPKVTRGAPAAVDTPAGGIAL